LSPQLSFKCVSCQPHKLLLRRTVTYGDCVVSPQGVSSTLSPQLPFKCVSCQPHKLLLRRTVTHGDCVVSPEGVSHSGAGCRQTLPNIGQTSLDIGTVRLLGGAPLCTKTKGTGHDRQLLLRINACYEQECNKHTALYALLLTCPQNGMNAWELDCSSGCIQYVQNPVSRSVQQKHKTCSSLPSEFQAQLYKGWATH
jgi:hypothetical protein